MFGIIKEFKEFAIKGNMIDMAVGIIIGAAFNKVIDVLVKQIILPPLSLLTDGINYADRKITLKEQVTEENGELLYDEIAIGYGAFVEVLIDFLIVGFTIFLVIKFMNRFRKKAQDPKEKSVETPKDIELLSNLNDLLIEQNKILREQKRE